MLIMSISFSYGVVENQHVQRREGGRKGVTQRVGPYSGYVLIMLTIMDDPSGTGFSDYDRRTGDNKTRPKTGASSSH